MTTLVSGTLDIAADKRDQAIAAAAQVIPSIRSQQGCNHYVFCADPTSDTRVYVYENWATTEDLAAHLIGPLFAQMIEQLGKFAATNIEVSKFRVDLEEPVYDEQGKPRADFFTG